MCVDKCHEVLVNLAACCLCLNTVLNHKRNVSLVDVNIVLLLMFLYKNINATKCSFSLSGPKI